MSNQDEPYHHPGRRRTALLSCAVIAATTFTGLTPATADTTADDGPAAGSAHPTGSMPAIYKRYARSARISKSVRMRHRFAEWSLRTNGIGWRSNGRCNDRDRVDCTSFDGMRWGSIDGLIDFKEDSGCRLVVSGGTERGHAPGRYSHGKGYKIDVMPSRCTDRHITRTYRHVGQRGDGAELYRSPAADVYAREDSHWDITFR
ncbi:hypothetical protein [Spirillospora sp. NPDC047279]|uniref:hypothetical protein n=1 Tax=Spirillospora sp. NPDC047279 TaxID=3155478 RepID=UPI0033D99C76